jgi:hypothetical protein
VFTAEGWHGWGAFCFFQYRLYLAIRKF